MNVENINIIISKISMKAVKKGQVVKHMDGRFITIVAQRASSSITSS